MGKVRNTEQVSTEFAKCDNFQIDIYCERNRLSPQIKNVLCPKSPSVDNGNPGHSVKITYTVILLIGHSTLHTSQVTKQASEKQTLEEEAVLHFTTEEKLPLISQHEQGHHHTGTNPVSSLTPLTRSLETILN